MPEKNYKPKSVLFEQVEWNW